jgi:hypothetical protein
VTAAEKQCHNTFQTAGTCCCRLLGHVQVLRHKDKKPAGGCEELQQQFK